MQSVRRRPLRIDVRELLLKHLLAGHLRAGRPVGEAALANHLGVSRTPLREAMLELERDFFLECQPGRGFVVRPLKEEEVRDLYPIVWTLEQLAVRSGPIDDRMVAELDRLNERFEKARSERKRVRMDLAWHARLAAIAGNERLGSILTSLKRRITRYEIAYMRGDGETGTSAKEHRGITSALRRGDCHRAAQLVESHWRRGMESLLQQMRTH